MHHLLKSSTLFSVGGVYCRTGGGDSSGPSAYNYRAKRYGGYYSTRYVIVLQIINNYTQKKQLKDI